MKNLFFILVLVTFVSLTAAAQDAGSTATHVTPESRFETVQVPWDRAITLRLDKYSGKVDRLSTCSRDDSVGSRFCWKEMIVNEQPKESQAHTPRYQIVMNGLLKRVFLLHVETGQMWEYGVDARQQWHPFVECN
ncbi:MAG TPA: hypothetical protein VL501_04625, partial [Pyrinomonadaceae bacterium]|nr:hypothetical protein [Pyrinomonadaceae bacterium]